MKVKHIQDCPICGKELSSDKTNPLHGSSPQRRLQYLDQIFTCCAPLANDPLHYYNHTVSLVDPDWMTAQEFTVDIGSRYVIFHNNYEHDKSWIKIDHQKAPLVIPALLLPDFPNLENLKRKIKLSITFS